MYTLYHNYDNVQEKLVWCYNTTIWLGNKGIESIEGAVLNNENPQRYLKADHELFSRKLNIFFKKKYEGRKTVLRTSAICGWGSINEKQNAIWVMPFDKKSC